MSASNHQTEPVLPVSPHRFSKLKLAFLYVLIGGLAASALVSIVALLIGSFNSEIQKSLQTIFILFSHSLFILALLWADKYNEVGRALLPTAIFGLTLANMITTILSTWEIISSESAWRALGLYFLIVGAVFIVLGILKLRVGHKATKVGLYISAASVGAIIVALAPWVLKVVSSFDPLYFRIIGALVIFASAAFLIAIILRGIAVARHPEFKTARALSRQISGGLLSIYITIGVITSMVWCAGFAGFAISSVEASNPSEETLENQYY